MAVPRSGSLAINSDREPDHQEVRAEATEGPDALRFRREQVRAVEDQGDLGQLRGLELHQAAADPALRAVDRRADAGQQDREEQEEQRKAGSGGQRLDRGGPATESNAHHDQADGAEDHGALQVIEAVAAGVEERARRAGAEHHHRAEGEQAEGRRQQQRVLERRRCRLWPPLAGRALARPCPLTGAPPPARGSDRRAPRSP